MKQKSIVVKLLVTVLLLSSAVAHAIPNLISYQGVLNDSKGTPMSSTVTMTFKIYDVDTGGTALWSETQNVQVSNGLFNVKLGSVQQFSKEIFNTDSIFLGIQVGSDPEMTPRQQLTSAAFAYRTPFINQDFLPVGTILAQTAPSYELAAGSINTMPGNNLTDSNADFISAYIKPNMKISFEQWISTGINGSTSSLQWSVVKESIISDSPSEGNYISKVENNAFCNQNNCEMAVTFFYSDGTSSTSVVKEVGGGNNWRTYSNPYPDKPVWKTDFLVRAVSPSNALYYTNVINTHFMYEKIQSVDSATQLTLDDSNFFKTNTELNYTVYATPKLLDNWAECNGQTVTDLESYYYNQALPDLNGSTPFTTTSIPVTWIMRIK